MRLTHIKLAGFKSFVDPTHIPVPGQLVAVVGPNGCGKSNVIDAVRWVLGESSAKQLRGESMQDVIFNGSNTRKGAARASVELIFDNAEGRAAGPWSQYGEISIKRILTRQGESSYHINNQQVRKRDIADLFLGTGVGTRGYAVIEQGMISRIIEARPEELRAFLEEAAGVSKYKERRRETESRMGDTRDNLMRVDDIRRELDAQLEKLSAQAEVAERFNQIKESISQKQNLLALQRKLDAERESNKCREEITAAELALESQTSRLRETEAQIELLREANYTASDDAQLEQTRLADAAATVARLEQRLLHLKETRQRLQNQMNEAKARLDTLNRQASDLAHEQTEWQLQLEEAGLAHEDAVMCVSEEEGGVPELDVAAEQASAALEDAQLAFSHARQTKQLAEQQAQHLDRTLHTMRARAERLEQDLRGVDQHDDDALDTLQLELETLSMAVEELQVSLESHETAIHDRENERNDVRHQLDQARAQEVSLLARRDVLKRLLASIGSDKALDQWVKSQGLEGAERVFQYLRIESGWERALESVLRERMHGLIVDSLPKMPAPARQVVVFGSGSQFSASANSLRAKVRSEQSAVESALDAWLANVVCVEDDIALDELQSPDGQTIWVTRSGHLRTANSLIWFAPDQAGGVLERQQELEEIESALATTQPEIESLRARLANVEAQLAQAHGELRHIRQRLDATRQQRGSKQVELARLTQARDEKLRRQTSLASDLEELTAQIADAVMELEASKIEASEAAAQMPVLEETVQTARLNKAEAETARDVHRSRLAEAQRAAQAAGFARQQAESRLGEIERRREALGQQQEEVRMRFEEAAFDLENVDEGEFDIGFQDALDARAACERAVAAARDRFNASTNALREKELEKSQIEQGFDPVRDRIGEWKLKEQEARLSLERFTQELIEAGADEESLRPLLGEGMKVQSLVGEIGRLTQQINQLGAVNLAALDELNTARERKGFLDTQADDLNAALETLESAIRKIDRETRSMLQDTFDKVNNSLQELFPTLFGGGQAELILTGDEILDAGIQIMARPPGKKNSTIHLLSGGEKALTALSLVFSLFRLNPAPFCLLDEVDAPLDDANTSRFCEMVKRMAERTQFLYISHNKLTMEMADQLVGITMQEQGVSRCVAVDIAEALEMREAAPA
ncbi:chromosome segregation protein SMC [Burkholderiaceae bacterium DAT-1]|nr:chromosome segregation protein SMC [Burkholderiaceae bacterium DAT-1]